MHRIIDLKKRLVSFFLLLSILLFSSAHAKQEVFGEWTTVDDESGKPKSIVLIEANGDGLKGTIQCLIKENVAKTHIDCDDHELKGQPIAGLTILNGFKADEEGKEWEDGTIMDPKNCKEYSSYLELKKSGSELKVRGYIGISLLGRTQVWRRTQPSDKTNCVKD